MIEEIRALRTSIEEWSRRVDASTLDGGHAARIVRELVRIEHSVSAVKARVARRVETSGAWTRSGHRTPGHWLASLSGTSVGQAARELETAEHLEDLPAVADAFARGRLSPQQVSEIADAATVVPEMARDLVDHALDHSLASTRDRCRRVKASADADDELARHRRIHAERHLRTWTDPDGAWRMDVRGTTTDGARIMARLSAETEAVFSEARRVGRRESLEAYRFDALVRTAETTGDDRGAARPQMIVNVDAAPLKSGRTRPGDTCEIKGIGPVPVDVARAMMDDAILTILVRDGIDLTTIAHDGRRTMPAPLRRAVLARDQVCVVEGCDAPASEIHHIERRADGGRHTIGNCRGLCSICHDLVHYRGYELVAGPDGAYCLRGPPVAAAA